MVLVRHSISEPEATIPASQWRLSHRGRNHCKVLAKQLEKYSLTLLISSIEAKAIETAKLTAEHLTVPTEIVLGLHEHERSNVGFMLSQERFRAQVGEFFKNPDELVFGTETANQARSRFSTAIEALIAMYGAGSFGVVTHGTVMSLYVAAMMGVTPFAFWQRLDMPAYVCVSLPEREVIEIVESISPDI